MDRALRKLSPVLFTLSLVATVAGSAPVWLVVGTFCLGFSVLLLSTILFLAFLRRRVEPEEEARLRIAVADLRTRLKVTRRDGFYLSSERLPWWQGQRQIVIVPKRAIEAAARMELQEDFDLNQFNAFCICLEGEQKHTDGRSRKSVTTPQHEALCAWILEISEKLIKVELERQPGGVYRLLSKRRFSFFINKVSKIQLWQVHENSGFKQLQSKVQDFMNQVAPWCDERYREIIEEEGGKELVAMQWTPAGIELKTPRLTDPEEEKRVFESERRRMSCDGTDPAVAMPFRTLSAAPPPTQMGQDHDKVAPPEASPPHHSPAPQQRQRVRAIRVDAEAKMEAVLERIVDPNPTEPDEEVFISQLHRRAVLLNNAFQQKVLEVVRRHAFDPRHAELSLEEMLRPPGLESSPDVKGFINLRCAFAAGAGVVQVHQAPVKTPARMREKLAEYASTGAMWPLAAHILDPVRVSLVVFGAAQILEVFGWFLKEAETGLPLVRVKNKFSFAREEVLGGYRDLMMSVVFEGPSGLRIIGEIQIQDKVLYDLKLKMHTLYKIKRANTAAKIF